MFVEVCVIVFLVCVETCVSFGLVFPEWYSPYSLQDSLFLCTIEQVLQAQHKFSKIFVAWVQLYFSGLYLEEFFVIVA